MGISTLTSHGTPQDRRMRSVQSAALMLGAGGAANLLISLSLAPLTLGYLGAERFGVWMAAIALAVVLEPLDLGVRSALLSLLAQSDSGGRHQESSDLVRTALRVLCSAAVGGTVLGYVVFPWLPLERITGAVSADAQEVVGPTVAVLGLALAVNLPLGLVDRVYLGLRQGSSAGQVILAGHAISFLAVLVLALNEAPVPLLAIGLVIGPILTRCFFGASLFLRQRPDLLHRSRAVQPEARRRLFADSRYYLALQAAVAVGFSTDQLVVASALGGSAVAEFNVPARAFAIVVAIVGLVARPLLPAFAEGREAADWVWIRRTFRRSMLGVALFATAVGLPLLLVGPAFYQWLGRGEIRPSWSLLLALFLWTILHACGTTLGAVLNGLHIHRPQLYAASAMATANIILSILAVRWIGVAGPVWASVVTYTAFVVIPLGLSLPRLMAAANRVQEPEPATASR